MNTRSVTLLFAAVLLPACSSIYYSAWEAFGYAKRDLLVERVEEAQESQTEAKEQIQTTFEAFKSLTGFDGGELESRYNVLNKEFERSKDSAADVSDRIDSIEKVSGDMFAEWSKELEEIQNPELRRKSETLKGATERDFEHLLASMRAAEARMPPVLTAFNDHVLFLKHNLNAQAITSLQDDVVDIESNVDQLIREMQDSIDEADAFLASINTDS